MTCIAIGFNNIFDRVAKAGLEGTSNQDTEPDEGY
jgi:hypothetical protein